MVHASRGAEILQKRGAESRIGRILGTDDAQRHVALHTFLGGAEHHPELPSAISATLRYPGTSTAEIGLSGNALGMLACVGTLSAWVGAGCVDVTGTGAGVGTGVGTGSGC